MEIYEEISGNFAPEIWTEVISTVLLRYAENQLGEIEYEGVLGVKSLVEMNLMIQKFHLGNGFIFLQSTLLIINRSLGYVWESGYHMISFINSCIDKPGHDVYNGIGSLTERGGCRFYKLGGS